MNLTTLQNTVKKLGSKKRSAISQRFFKTGPGEYGEGDVFLGIRVPELRKLAKDYEDLPVNDTTRLLKSTIHEFRLLALLIMVRRFESGDEAQKKKIYTTYLANKRWINNWDLVDVTVSHIVGGYLLDKNKAPLYKLVQSKNIWERRMSIIATSRFIKENRFSDTLKISRILLRDEEDLIHKAVGWMLREVGKKDVGVEERFLKTHYQKMPRTMLRYAIERFPEPKRQRYLKGLI